LTSLSVFKLCFKVQRSANLAFRRLLKIYIKGSGGRLAVFSAGPLPGLLHSFFPAGYQLPFYVWVIYPPNQSYESTKYSPSAVLSR
jgi:hypothetical protein